MKAQKIAFLSDEYFRLLAARPDIAAALALGEQVTIVVDGQAYQVVSEGQSSGPVVLPPTLLPAAPLLPTITPAVPAETVQRGHSYRAGSQCLARANGNIRRAAR